MPKFKCHSEAIVCRAWPGSPMIRDGGSRCSFFRGIKRAKTRRTSKPTEFAQACSSSTSRSRASTVLNETRTSRPNRSTQPSSIVQSRCASVPSARKSRSNRESIHPKFIFLLCSIGILRNRSGATAGLPVKSTVRNRTPARVGVTLRSEIVTKDGGPRVQQTRG